MSWGEFRTISDAKDFLKQTEWEALEGLAVRKLLEDLVPEEDETSWRTILACFTM